MIYIIRGDLTIAHAIGSGQLEAIGSASARRRLPAWLNPSPLAQIPSQRPETAAR
jgi:hypothetical protein